MGYDNVRPLQSVVGILLLVLLPLPLWSDINKLMQRAKIWIVQKKK